MKLYKRSLSLLMVAALLLIMIGCQRSDTAASAPQQPEAVAMATEEPAAIGTPQPVPTPTLDPNAEEKFAALDLEVFRWYVTDDGYTYHSLVSDPIKFGIDPATVPMTLGDFTEEASLAKAEEAAVYLEQLNAIPRFALDETEQLSYDALQQFLENMTTDAAYPYYYEPLTEYSGIHANLPLMFGLFQMDSVQDVEDYLALFADVPRFLAQVLAYEQERANRDMFMTEEALSAILDGCKTIINSKKNSFLYATFADALDGVEGLTEEQRNDYEKRNETLIKSDYIDAYQDLYDGLQALKNACRDPEGACALGKQGKAYYEYAMQGQADNRLTVSETLDLLKNEMYNIYVLAAEIQQDNPSAWSEAANVGSGNTEEDLDLLRKIASEILPELPEHILELDNVPEELESLMSPACYEIPALDDWTRNRVLINLSEESDTMLLTLAHEAYPGHLYQYVYQRGNEKLGVTQRALHYGGYAEGWAQLAEFLVTETQEQYPKDYTRLRFYNGILANAVVPAVVSILVNYYDYGKTSVKTFLSSLGLGDDAYVDSYYSLAVDQPYYTISYAVGYCQLMGLIRDAQTDLGESYDQKAFLTAYLDLGPCFFNLIQERMDVWVDNKMTEEEI